MLTFLHAAPRRVPPVSLKLNTGSDDSAEDHSCSDQILPAPEVRERFCSCVPESVTLDPATLLLLGQCIP